MHKLAIIIPTRNRPTLLAQTLRSLQAQTRRPDQVIVVDGSDEPVEGAVGRFELPLRFVRVMPPSLTRQRNAGRQAAAPDATLVGYLDDDIVLEPDALAVMVRFWDRAGPEVGGASFHITNAPYQRPGVLYRLFLIGSLRRGIILKSGFATAVETKDEINRSEWLCGGATIWRREVVDRLTYDEWFGGAANYEDADFSYRAGREWQLVVLRDAKIGHYPPPFDPKKMRLYGEMHVTYRWYFVKKHFRRTFPAFYWSTAGLIGSSFASALLGWSRPAFYSGCGAVVGLAKVLAGRAGAIHKEFRKEEKHSAAYGGGDKGGPPKEGAGR